jgi:hypothetical protein
MTSIGPALTTGMQTLGTEAWLALGRDDTSSPVPRSLVLAFRAKGASKYADAWLDGCGGTLSIYLSFAQTRYMAPIPSKIPAGGTVLARTICFADTPKQTARFIRLVGPLDSERSGGDLPGLSASPLCQSGLQWRHRNDVAHSFQATH